jgi:hypothetical protein
MGLGYEDDLSYVGSGDSLVPNSVFANLIRNVGGTTTEKGNVSNRGEFTYECILQTMNCASSYF